MKGEHIAGTITLHKELLIWNQLVPGEDGRRLI